MFLQILAALIAFRYNLGDLVVWAVALNIIYSLFKSLKIEYN